MVGQIVGHYRIESKLGEGGMGVVYLARDLNLNRDVAMKFLSSEIAEESHRQRFQREAQTASSLNHPHILTVYDAGTLEGQQYLVTEFIDGFTLRQWAQREEPSWRQVLELMTGIADALACAHQAGILHRDVKPENILIPKSGHSKLIDFGIAKLLEGPSSAEMETRTISAGRTRPGFILGTVAYMSPEQAAGKPVDARSDIFSFGVVLYELLMKRHPFSGATGPEMLNAIVHASPAPLTEDLPFALRNIVEKALEKDPADRYQAMREMVVDLRRLARQKVEQAAPDALGAASHRVLPWHWVAMAALALVSGVSAWLIRGTSASRENPLANARFTRFTDFPGSEVDAAVSPDGKFVAFLSDREGPFDVWLSQVGSGRFVNLTQGKVGELRGPLRGVGFSANGSEIWLGGGDPESRMRLMPLMGGEPRNFLGETSVNAAWSPDGTRVVFHTRDPGDPIFVADRTGANTRQIFINEPGLHNHYPVWSPDSQWIYFVRGRPATTEMDLWRIPSAGGKPERLTQHNNDVAYPAPIDRRTVLYVMPDEDGSGPWLWALDVERKRTHRVSFGLEKYTSVAASTDGERLVATVANPSASLWSVPILDRAAEERDVKPFPLPNVRALAPRYGPKSLFYLSSSGAGDGLWRYQDWQALEIWKGSDGPLFVPPAVSPDGLHVAVALKRQGRLRLHSLSADGAELQPLTEAIDVQGTGSWSPDGKWIVTAGNDGQGPGLFKIPVDGGAPVRLIAGTALNPVWSPDGSLIVYTGPNVATSAPLLAVRSNGAREELPPIKVRREGERARFLPDGKGLIYMQGVLRPQDFWVLDLATRKTHRLTRLNNLAAMRTFDITPDGKQIVFDRLRENSDIVLIDRPRKVR